MGTSNSPASTVAQVRCVVIGFAIAGLLMGVISSAFLYFFTGKGQYPMILGFNGSWHFYALPIVATVTAAFYAYILSKARRIIHVGPLFGALVATLAFLTVTLLLSFYVAGRDLLEVFVGFALFGGIILGWLLVGTGAVTGIILARRKKQEKGTDLFSMLK